MLGSKVKSISTEILDIPTIREHKLSSLSVTRQSYVLVRVLSEDGIEGIGEAATLGGPQWAEETVESIETVHSLGLETIVDNVLARWFTNDFAARAPGIWSQMRAMFCNLDPQGYMAACMAMPISERILSASPSPR